MLCNLQIQFCFVNRVANKIWQLSPPLYISSRYTWIICFLYAYIYTHTLRSVWIIFLLCTYAIACNSWNETSRMLSILKGLPFCLSTSLKWSPSSSNDMHLCKHTHTRTYIHKHKQKKTLTHARTHTNTHTCILEWTHPSWCQKFRTFHLHNTHTNTDTGIHPDTDTDTNTNTHNHTNSKWYMIYTRAHTHTHPRCYILGF